MVTDNNSNKLDLANKDAKENFNTLFEQTARQHGPFVMKDEVWINSLAESCNEFGMKCLTAQEHVIRYVSNQPGGKEMDIIRFYAINVKNVCDSNFAAHNTFGKAGVDECYTPIIPQHIYDTLPQFFAPIVELYDDPRERDIVFLSTLVVLSSCFPNLWGVYDNRKCSANLFLFVTAPASSGKGCINSVRSLGTSIQSTLDKKYSEALEAYEDEKEDTPDEIVSKGKKPQRKLLFIPANNTSAKMIDTMSRNKTFGVVMDTEADTLTQSLKSQHGNFSELFRKAFHNEPVEMQRKTNDEYIALARTYLSVLLSGTNSQIGNLIDNLENGFFHRFMFYDYSPKVRWKDVFARKDKLPEDVFLEQSMRLSEFVERLECFAFDPELNKGIEFKLKEDQHTNSTCYSKPIRIG